MISTIAVRSHVARDLLQSAALFKTEKHVVWEYVANSLQYRQPGTTAVVAVTLNQAGKEIVIEDNGRGMDREGLQDFFVMHGENKDRKAGQGGRGRFGTGKSAAFGIANKLVVSSVFDGRRNTVELTRKDIEAAGEQPIPVRFLEFDAPDHRPNGTTIRIEQINLRKLDQRSVIDFIERHITNLQDNPAVDVNGHQCEATPIPFSETRVAKPGVEQGALLGDVALTLKVSKSPLDSDRQGVAIYANGNWLETTLAGAAGQPMAQYIFGALDVPALDDESAPIPAFDISRSMQLNQSNEVVQAVWAFVGYEVDILRRELVKHDKLRRAQEDAKRLNQEAKRIAEMINNDFRSFTERIEQVKAKSSKGHDVGHASDQAGDDADNAFVPGGDTRVSPNDESHSEGAGGAAQEPEHSNDGGSRLKKDEFGESKGKPRGGEGREKQRSGGFSVEFRDMGDDAHRAAYVSSERAIYINLGHPQISAAKGAGDIGDPIFRRLAYEVAFSEYSIALAMEMDKTGDLSEPSDAVFEIRETLNRMARRAAALYAP